MSKRENNDKGIKKKNEIKIISFIEDNLTINYSLAIVIAMTHLLFGF